jgi:hypothetical protein
MGTSQAVRSAAPPQQDALSHACIASGRSSFVAVGDLRLLSVDQGLTSPATKCCAIFKADAGV